MQELKNERTLNKKIFEKPDGSRVARIFSGPQHYFDPNRMCFEDINPIPLEENNWETTNCVKANPYRVYFGDSTDDGHLFSFEKNDNTWVNIKAWNVTIKSNPSVSSDRAIWFDLWTDTDLEYEVLPFQLKERIIIKSPLAPKEFTFTIKKANRVSIYHDAERNELVFHNGCEDDWIIMRRPYAYTDLDGDMEGIDCDLILTEKIGEYIAFKVAVDNKWVNERFAAGATRIIIDPTVQIKGSTDTEDNTLYKGAVNNNYGNATSPVKGTVGWGADPFKELKTILRIKSSAIKALGAANYNGATLYVKPYEIAAGVTEHTISVYRIKEANYQWVEGSANGAPEVGACCWNKKIYNTDDWAGSAGLNTAGTDYYSSSIGSIIVSTGDVGSWKNTSISTDVISDWETESDNAGMLLSWGAYENLRYARFHMSEDGASDQWYLEIDYNLPSADPPTIDEYITSSTTPHKLDIAIEYTHTLNVTRARIAIASNQTDLPTGDCDTGATDMSDGKALKIYDSDDGDIAAPSGSSGTYIERIEIFERAKLYITVGLIDVSNNVTDWQTPQMIYVLGSTDIGASVHNSLEDLLKDVRDRIISEVPDIVSCRVLNAPDELPPEVQFPFVGVTGYIGEYIDAGNGFRFETDYVDVYIYQQIEFPEGNVLGFDSKKGVEALAKLIKDALENHLWDTTYWEAACESMFPAEPFTSVEGRETTRKRVRFVYKRQYKN